MKDTGNMNNGLIKVLFALQVATQIAVLNCAITFPSPILLVLAGVAAALVHTKLTPAIVHGEKWDGPLLARYPIPMKPTAISNVFLATSILAAICNCLLVGLLYSIPGTHASTLPFAALIAIVGTAVAGGAVNALVTILEMGAEKE